MNYEIDNNGGKSTISYELAFKLKKAGFPFKRINAGDFADRFGYIDFCPDFDAQKGDVMPEEGCHFYVPNLSEFIEECGDGLNEIRRVTNENRFQWEANTIKITPMIYYGHTPEEAVANLWLALNKKV
jgi:hypothetical protein